MIWLLIGLAGGFAGGFAAGHAYATIGIMTSVAVNKALMELHSLMGKIRK